MADFDDGYNPDAAVIKHVKGGTFWNPTDVAIMYATSAPAKRPFELGDTPLKTNDLYIDQNGERWRWNGTVFVCATAIPIRMGVLNVTATQAMNINTIYAGFTSPVLPSKRSVLVESVIVNCQASSPYIDSNNYWEMRFYYGTTLNTYGPTGEILGGTVVTYNSNNGSSRSRYLATLGVVLDSTIGMDIGYSATKVGTPGNLSTRVCFITREVQ